MGMVIIVLLAAITLWTTIQSIQTGTTHAVLRVIGMQEFERAENPAFFWGVIGFNWLVVVGFAVLVVLWF